MTTDLSEVGANDCDFNYNGIVTLEGHEEPRVNPKYYEEIKEYVGTFLPSVDGTSSILFFVKNKDASYDNWTNGVSFYSPINITGQNWRPSPFYVEENQNEIEVENQQTYPDVESSTYRVFPNPTNQYVNIEVPSNLQDVRIRKLSVISMNGEVLDVSFMHDGTVLRGDLSSLPSGLYFISILNDEGIWAEKVLVQN